MKTLITLSLLTLLSINNSFAGDTVQYIDCRFPNPESTDHVVVSLKDTQNGTLFYTTGLDNNGDDENTGKLSLVRLADKKEYAQFSATWKTIQDGGVVLVEFHFSMPKNLIFKSSNSFMAGFSTTITDAALAPLRANDDLECFSRIYPTNQPKAKK